MALAPQARLGVPLHLTTGGGPQVVLVALACSERVSVPPRHLPPPG